MFPQTSPNDGPTTQANFVNDLFAQHYQASLRTARRILRTREDAEDAVQTAYCAAFRHLDGFRSESSFKTWIIRIVVNCCLLHLRERRGKWLVGLDDVRAFAHSHVNTPETLCYLGELETAHRKAAAELPQTLKTVYDFYMHSGDACALISRRLGLTPAAAKSRLFRARRRVETSLKPVIQRRAA